MIDSFRGKYFFLSNIYPVTIRRVFNGYEIKYPSLENAFQAEKTNSLDERTEISKMKPLKARAYGKRIRLGKNSLIDWDEKKLAIMEDLIRQKFSENSELRELLISTGDEYIEEGNYWGDTFWGTCGGKGKNHLGKILMKVRRECKQRYGRGDPMNKKVGKGYKVVRVCGDGGMRSCVVEGKGSVVYNVGIYSVPYSDSGPLCAFRDLESAHSFVRSQVKTEGGSSKLEIWNCDFIEYHTQGSSLWHVTSGGVSAAKWDIPAGTVLCSSIAVTSRIEDDYLTPAVPLDNVRNMIELGRAWFIDALLNGTIDNWDFNYAVMDDTRKRKYQPVILTTYRTFTRMVETSEYDAPKLVLWVPVKVVESISAHGDMFIVLQQL
jgi:ribA/ribD-fused uncharacterized protein